MGRRMNQEQERLDEQYSSNELVPKWQKWGPYVAERAWGTVREDYSHNGDSWSYFPSILANSKVYRWGEDAIAGWCDRYQVLVFAPVFWNGCDPILKERLWGLNSSEGNHGEDVKEYYFHLDGIPSHAYMKFLYKYPQREFPYRQIVEENKKRGTHEKEYELVDTGIFSENRYFDIFIEYAKHSAEDLCIKIEAFNRGPEEAPLHIIPHLWFRNSWGWGDQRLPEPIIYKKNNHGICLIADDSQLQSPKNLMFDYHLGKRYLYGPAGGKALFTDNENYLTLRKKHFKEAFHRYLVNKENVINPDETGTKSCIDYFFKIPPKSSVTLYLRLSDKKVDEPLNEIEAMISTRKKEADEFYASIHPKESTDDEKRIQRQAFAGMLWNKQIYLFDVNLWLRGDNTHQHIPLSPLRLKNVHWWHINSMRIMLMPDKWEYPWFAAWDLAFHALTVGLVDIEFAKEQLWFLLFDQFQHPNGQIPAYEWDFSDLNPPVHAYAVWQLYCMEKERFGREDRSFLKKCLAKLLMNFTWWVNRVDSMGLNVFEGGFLGLDNIAIIDRSEKLPGKARVQQSDGTGWMGMYCLNLMRIALEIAKEDSSYESIATKFFQHFISIAYAMTIRGNHHYELWNEEEGFFYDVLSYPDKTFKQLTIRSLVGIIPLFAIEVLTEEEIDRFPTFKKDFEWILHHRDHFANSCVDEILDSDGKKKYLLSFVKGNRMERILRYIWDPNEFRSEFGLRSLSKYYEKHPYYFENWKLNYEPAESLVKVKGGNSNWRGPIWMPTAFLLIETLWKYSFHKNLKINIPGEESVTLEEIADNFAKSLVSLFAENQKGYRPFWGEDFPYKDDPYWKDFLLFYEYFHGDNGRGLGASHQTGWTGLIANLIDKVRRRTPKE